jgi:hypothetical protein
MQIIAGILSISGTCITITIVVTLYRLNNRLEAEKKRRNKASTLELLEGSKVVENEDKLRRPTSISGKALASSAAAVAHAIRRSSLQDPCSSFQLHQQDLLVEAKAAAARGALRAAEVEEAKTQSPPTDEEASPKKIKIRVKKKRGSGSAEPARRASRAMSVSPEEPGGAADEAAGAALPGGPPSPSADARHDSECQQS